MKSAPKTSRVQYPHIKKHAGVFGNILKKLGVENEFTLTNMKILCVKNYYSNLKSKNELNIEFQPIDNAIVDTINWFKYRGMLDNKGKRY